MRKLITIKAEFNSLKNLESYLSKETNYKIRIKDDVLERKEGI